jgi:hypothetical protein
MKHYNINQEETKTLLRLINRLMPDDLDSFDFTDREADVIANISQTLS